MKKQKQETVGDVEIKSALHALGQSDRLESVWSRESALTQKTIIYIAKLLEENNRLLIAIAPHRATKREGIFHRIKVFFAGD